MKNKFTHKILAASILFISLNTNAQIINTYAGTGTAGYNGDGISATNAQLKMPCGVAIDATGNVYIADLANARIRKISTSGIISTFAGTGVSGYSGDGGQANLAQLTSPTGVAADGNGNIFIADQGGNRIRVVDNTGIISTFAGTGVAGFSGDGAAANLAKLSGPYTIAFDVTGNVYIADANNDRVRKVNTSGIISTVAGNGTTGFNGDGITATSAQLFTPYGVAIDPSGDLFIADNGNNRIRKVNSLGTISTVAGTGGTNFSGDGAAATLAEVNGPTGIAFDANGNLFIADFGNNRIRKVNTSGIISTFAGVSGISGFSGDGGPAISADLNGVFTPAINASGVYIPDRGNSRIRLVTLTTDINQSENIITNYTIYPNPSNSYLSINSKDKKEATVTLCNILGEVLYKNNLQENLNIDLLNFSSNIYFLNIQSNDKIVTKKIIINH